ncbi:hypothetical protein B0J12DRAFT_641016 [Macrophomina phaseolina]|uniref:Uncharacterized protein n=1 Tax=Macrophomina phaseolina TaxID=35725 RepID=A0ABQ8GWH6_9PEZI|nr:hypothetical protein B0J12DRAFT_641016 [Macrophomina phaseolina]
MRARSPGSLAKRRRPAVSNHHFRLTREAARSQLRLRQHCRLTAASSSAACPPDLALLAPDRPASPSAAAAPSAPQPRPANHQARGSNAPPPETRALSPTSQPPAACRLHRRFTPSPERAHLHAARQAWPGMGPSSAECVLRVPHRSRSCRRTQRGGALATGQGAPRGMAHVAMAAVRTALRGASRRNQESDQR